MARAGLTASKRGCAEGVKLDKRSTGGLGVGQPGDLGVGMGEGQRVGFPEDPFGRLSASPAADLEPPGTLVGRGRDRILVALDTGQEVSRAREDSQGT